ncbi:MAG: hypothetical protein Q8P59_11595, partial [Dehalococcoidia bacterium]|nr:hypothetical protein [Dehalococcoidia bacterium]
RRPLLKAALRGIAKGHRFMRANKDKTVQYFVEARKGATQEQANGNYDDWLNLFGWRDGLAADAAVQETVTFQREVLGIKEADFKFTVAQGFDFSFAIEARDELNAAGWKP